MPIEIEKIIKKKKVDFNLLSHCIGKDGYLTYNALIKKDKRKLELEEYLLLKEMSENEQV